MLRKRARPAQRTIVRYNNTAPANGVWSSSSFSSTSLSLVRSLGRARSHWPPSFAPRIRSLLWRSYFFRTRRNTWREEERQRYHVVRASATTRVMLVCRLKCTRFRVHTCTHGYVLENAAAAPTAVAAAVVGVVVKSGRESAWVACVRAAGGRMRAATGERRTEWNLPPPPPETSPPQDAHT